MRKIAICTALLAFLLSTTASAKNDFDALLGELTFGGSPAKGGQTLTLDNIAADKLAPAPMTPVSAQVPAEDPATEAVVVPVPEPEALSDPATEQVGVPVHLETQPMTQMGVAGQSCDSGACSSCSSCSGGCGGQQGQSCNLFKKHHISCVPHTPPNLPTSSFYEYFKSNSCNCRVWDGWQNRCVGTSKHSRGECDCFTPRQRKSCLSGVSCRLPRGVCPAGQAACSSSGCHEVPEAWQKAVCAGEPTCAVGTACDSSGCDG